MPLNIASGPERHTAITTGWYTGMSVVTKSGVSTSTRSLERERLKNSGVKLFRISILKRRSFAINGTENALYTINVWAEQDGQQKSVYESVPSTKCLHPTEKDEATLSF